jgi:hypothetical protein
MSDNWELRVVMQRFDGLKSQSLLVDNPVTSAYMRVK